MNAPPVLRPLRAILQRRLQTVPSRPIRTPYYFRASQSHLQRRCNSSIPPDQPPNPESPAPKASKEQGQTVADAEATSTEHAAGRQVPGNADISTEAVGGASAQDSVPQAPQAEIHVNVANVSTANSGPAVPRLDGLLVRSAFQKLKSAGKEIQAGIEEAVARQLQADEAGTVEVSQAVASETIETEPSPAEAEAGAGEMLTSQTTEAVDATPSSEEVSAPETPVSEPTDSHTVPPPGEMAQTTTAPPGIAGLFENASPEEIMALRAYLQQLQAQKLEGSAEAPAPQPVAPKVSAPENVAQPAAPEPSVPESPSAEAVASMTAPVEPSGQQPETKQAGEVSSEQVVSDLKSPETDTLETGDSKTRTDYDAMLDFFVPVSEQAKETQPQQKLSATEPTGGPVADSDGKSTDDIYDLKASEDEKPAGKDHPLESALDEELASKLDQVKASEGESLPEAQEDGGKELSRLPRNVQAYYLQPLRRVAEYGVPSCDLQLRSYSLRPLESFCDFALRAAYYLGLPAYGPVPLPKIIERWTVPKSTFIYKKAQENFERITRRRLIQIRDGHPETVQIWLAFLQKHQQAAVGMKANMWEFSSINVAKEMDKALEEADPLINDKLRLLAQNKPIETVEKVDELLQSERYRLTGGQFTGGM